MCNIKCSYECVASYPGSCGPGSVKYVTCPLPNMRQDCPKRQKFNDLWKEYQSKGDAPAAALWKARQILHIPTEYDIGGEVRSWRKAYRAHTVPEIEEQERAFIGSSAPALHCQPPEREQISIWEVLKNDG